MKLADSVRLVVVWRGLNFPAADAKGEDYDRVFFSKHPDVGMVIPFNRTLRVKSIRALETEANFRPYEAAARVFIIDDAHRMNASASNALLKTLEEPPATSHIFLVTSKPDTLLPTIRSRSQILRFGPAAPAEIERLLLTTHEYSQEDARLVAAYSAGNVSVAVAAEPHGTSDTGRACPRDIASPRSSTAIWYCCFAKPKRYPMQKTRKTSSLFSTCSKRRSTSSGRRVWAKK